MKLTFEICIFIDSGIFNEGEGVGVILRILRIKIIKLFFVEKPYQTQIIIQGRVF